jgi:hypothetical protein
LEGPGVTTDDHTAVVFDSVADIADQSARAWSLAVSAANLSAAGDTAGAADAARESVALYTALYAIVDDTQRSAMAMQVLSTAGYLPPAECITAVQNAVQALRDLHTAQPDDPTRRNNLAWSLAVLAAHRGNHDTTGAADAARESVALYTANLDAIPVAQQVVILTQVASTSGYLPTDAAVAPVQLGVEMLRVIVDQHPDDAGYHDSLASLLAIYAARLNAADRPAEAEGAKAEVSARLALRDLGYAATANGAALPFIRSLDTYERIWGLASTGGQDIGMRALAVATALEGRWCAVPDAIAVGADGELHLQSHGATHGRWRKSLLRYRFASAGSGLTDEQVAEALSKAFDLWANVSPGYFSFIPVQDSPDIEASFGGTELDPQFGTPFGRAASALPPEAGKLYFDRAETWTTTMLLDLAAHEIGHVLGLGYSDDQFSIMYPIGMTNNPSPTLGREAENNLRELYFWSPPAIATGHTSGRLGLSVAGPPTFVGQPTQDRLVISMRGEGDNRSVYWATYNGTRWDAPQWTTFGSSHGPALAAFDRG